jgi:ABC-type molybdate transport system ATPase subunit
LWFAYSLFLDNLLQKRLITPLRETADLIQSESPFSGEDNIYLENRSVRENIMYGKIQATEEEYNRARDTALVDENAYISKSMKQRSALARRLISNPDYIDIKKELPDCDLITIKEIVKNIKINYPEIKIL